MNVTLAESGCAAGIRALLYQWIGGHVDPVQQTRQTPPRFNVQMIHRSTAIAMEREKSLRLWCVFIADLGCPVYWRSIAKTAAWGPWKLGHATPWPRRSHGSHMAASDRLRSRNMRAHGSGDTGPSGVSEPGDIDPMWPDNEVWYWTTL
jgi:hypothetical protein